MHSLYDLGIYVDRVGKLYYYEIDFGTRKKMEKGGRVIEHDFERTKQISRTHQKNHQRSKNRAHQYSHLPYEDKA